MENHAVIGRVGIVVVAEPVGCTHMDFDISHPHFAVDFNFGVEKIGTGIGVKHSGVDNPDALAIDGCEPLRLPQAVLPHILHQFFHGQRIKLPIKLVNIEKTSNKTAEKSGYMSIMLCFAHSSICSSGQIEACTSPMWAFWSKNIHRRL